MPFLIAKASKPPIEAAQHGRILLVSTGTKESKVANVIYWSAPKGWYSKSTTQAPINQNVPEHGTSGWHLWLRSFRAYADQDYGGLLEAWVQENLNWHLEIVKRVTPGALREQAWATARERQKQGASVVKMWAGSKMSRGVDILPRRWVVERTFGWLGRYRRHSKDYETLTESSEAHIRIAMTHLMLQRITRNRLSW